MRGVIVLVLAVGCSDHRAPPTKVLKGSAVTQGGAAPAPREGTEADRLVDRAMCGPTPVPVATWIGRWDGERPFDPANPLAHRGPTRVTITAAGDSLHVAEGVGADGYAVDLALDPDGIVARGQTVTEQVAVAACFDVHHGLHLWRVLGARGSGIQATHEEDEVVLAPVPVVPRPPPPSTSREGGSAR